MLFHPFHQPHVAAAPQKESMLLLYSPSISPAQRKLLIKACFSAFLPSAPRSGGSSAKHASLPPFHQPRAAEAPQKSMLFYPFHQPHVAAAPQKESMLLLYSPTFHQPRAAEAPQKSMLLRLPSISPAQRRLLSKACFSPSLPSAPRSGSSPEKHAFPPPFISPT